MQINYSDELIWKDEAVREVTRSSLTPHCIKVGPPYHTHK